VNIVAKKIVLRTKKQVFGEMLGNNASKFEGEGFEFAELREYVFGDDVRKIDWKTTAKLRKPFIKIYREERELNVVVSTMLGGSTYFGTSIPKSEYIAELLGILGFSAVKNGDLFTHLLFTDKIHRHSRPSKKVFAVIKEVEEVVEFETLGRKSDFAKWCDTLYRYIKKKSLMFLISDFVGDIDLRLLSRKHDVFVIIVRDRFEDKPEGLGYIRLIDPETREGFEGDINFSVMADYEKALRANDHKLFKHLRQNGIRYAKLYTDEEPFAKLIRKLR
jgi:uncharacterized protein (DUF58 family)